MVIFQLAVAQKNLFLVYEIWNEFKKYYEPCVVSLHKFIWSFSKLKDLESAFNVLQLMISLFRQGSASVGIDPFGKIIKRLDIPILYKNDFSSELAMDKDNMCSMISKNEGRAEKPEINDVFHGNNLASLNMENQFDSNRSSDNIFNEAYKIDTSCDPIPSVGKGMSILFKGEYCLLV